MHADPKQTVLAYTYTPIIQQQSHERGDFRGTLSSQTGMLSLSHMEMTSVA